MYIYIYIYIIKQRFIHNLFKVISFSSASAFWKNIISKFSLNYYFVCKVDFQDEYQVFDAKIQVKLNALNSFCLILPCAINTCFILPCAIDECFILPCAIDECFILPCGIDTSI